MDLKKHREEIDDIDWKILDLLNKRIKISKIIGKYKEENNLEIKSISREQEITNKIQDFCNKNNLDKKYINEIFKIILEYSRNEQKKLIIPKLTIK